MRSVVLPILAAIAIALVPAIPTSHAYLANGSRMSNRIRPTAAAASIPSRCHRPSASSHRHDVVVVLGVVVDGNDSDRVRPPRRGDDEDDDEDEDEGRSSSIVVVMSSYCSTILVAASVIFASMASYRPVVAHAVSGGGLDYAGLDISGNDYSNGDYKGKDFTQVRPHFFFFFF